MSAWYPVIKTILETGGKKKKENSMEIDDFDPQIVQKMVAVCETENVDNFDGQEEELFKIGHKYQIQELKVSFIIHHGSFMLLVSGPGFERNLPNYGERKSHPSIHLCF